MDNTFSLTRKVLNATVIVTALGYLVDVYDIIIFNVTRVASLTDLGLSGTALTDAGLFILNMQLMGLILGGLFFGVMGDKIGRKKCLLGSILLYSLATLACAFVQNADQYAFLRFASGFGLAGEVGIGVALITETMTKERRTLGVTLFTFIGIGGALIASIAAAYLPWRTCYMIGGVAGLLLLITRSMIMESGMFEQTKKDNIECGSLRLLFSKSKLRLKYVFCILLGMPIFFVLGIVWTLSPEIGRAIGVSEPLVAAIAYGIGTVGTMTGDLCAGLLSQAVQKRRVVITVYLFGMLVLFSLFLCQTHMSAFGFYAFCFGLGLGTGYWINLVMLAAEQFGINLRATASTSIPNFARATLLPMNLALGFLKGHIGLLPAVGTIGFVALMIAAYSLYRLKETFGKDLNYYD